MRNHNMKLSHLVFPVKGFPDFHSAKLILNTLPQRINLVHLQIEFHLANICASIHYMNCQVVLM